MWKHALNKTMQSQTKTMQSQTKTMQSQTKTMQSQTKTMQSQTKTPVTKSQCADKRENAEWLKLTDKIFFFFDCFLKEYDISEVGFISALRQRST